jgi:hypothetical protein
MNKREKTARIRDRITEALDNNVRHGMDRPMTRMEIFAEIVANESADEDFDWGTFKRVLGGMCHRGDVESKTSIRPNGFGGIFFSKKSV